MAARLLKILICTAVADIERFDFDISQLKLFYLIATDIRIQ